MRIVLATDGSATAQDAVKLISSIPLAPGSTIEVISVAPSQPLLGADLQVPEGVHVSTAREAATAIAESAARQLQSAGHRATATVLGGEPDEEILLVARDADLIVAGIHGVGRLRRLLVGSVASSIARQAAAPVLLVQSPPSLGNALIAIDESDEIDRVIGVFIELARASSEKATLLHVSQPDAELPGRVAEVQNRLEEASMAVERVTAAGNEVEQIVLVATEIGATLIVMGKSARTLDGEAMLGSTARGVIDRAPCSILVGR